MSDSDYSKRENDDLRINLIFSILTYRLLNEWIFLACIVLFGQNDSEALLKNTNLPELCFTCSMLTRIMELVTWP